MAETCSRCGGKSDYLFASLCRNCARQLEQRASELESAMGLSSPQELGTFLDSLDKLEDAEERIPPDDYVDMLDELVKVYAALAKGPPHLSTPYERALLLVEPLFESALQERQQEKESKKKEQRKREEERRRRQLAEPHRHALEQREKVFLELVEKNPAASAAHLELARFYVRNGDRLPGGYPQEWGVELLLKAAHAYVKAIALGFRDKEREAAAKVEFAELGKDFYHPTSPGSSFVSSLSKWRDKVLESVDEMGLDFLFCSELKSEWDNIDSPVETPFSGAPTDDKKVRIPLAPRLQRVFLG